MCTITVVPRGDGFRLACNRDERRDRPAALPPHVHILRDRAAAFPVDPVGGGSWIGVNDAGLAVALLNRTSQPPAQTRRRSSSRGVIVPRMLSCETQAEAIDAARRLDQDLFQPYRLVLVQGASVTVVTSDGPEHSTEFFTLDTPLLFTSSSLGDAVVETPRRELFERLLVDDEDWLHGQFRFHRHAWPRRPEISVTMRRSDAATVSRTIVEVGLGRLDISYEPVCRAC